MDSGGPRDWIGARNRYTDPQTFLAGNRNYRLYPTFKSPHISRIPSNLRSRKHPFTDDLDNDKTKWRGSSKTQFQTKLLGTILFSDNKS